MGVMTLETSTPEDAELTAKGSAVLDAALVAFAEQGYAGASVPDIARAAGVGVGTIYRHFGDKNGLVNAVMARAYREMAAMTDEVDFDLPARSWHRAFFFAAARWARADRNRTRFIEMHHHTSYLRGDVLAIKSRWLERILGKIARNIADESCKELPPALLGSICWGGLIEMMRAEQYGLLVLDDATIAAAEQCVWEAIRL